MTLPRFLFLLVLIVAATPWLSVELLRSTSPALQGQFTEETDQNRYFLNNRDFRYQAPAEIGTRHTLTLPSLLPGLSEDERSYATLGPTGGPARPALVLLHGAGRSNRAMLDMWQELARRKNLILIAPQSAGSSGWSLWHDGAFFTGALIDDAARHHPIDRDQIYLIGHSMGGKFALRLANLGIGDWAAVSVHAGHITAGTVLPARKPVPIYLQTGSKDPIFTPKRLRSAAEQLADAGHDVHLRIIPDHTHWYYRIAPQIAETLWNEMRDRQKANTPTVLGALIDR